MGRELLECPMYKAISYQQQRIQTVDLLKLNSEIEMKINYIMEKYTFEGLTGGLDISMKSSNNIPRSDFEMLSIPVTVLFQTCSPQTAFSELVEFILPRNRKLSDPGSVTVKKIIIENEV